MKNEGPENLAGELACGLALVHVAVAPPMFTHSGVAEKTTRIGFRQVLPHPVTNSAPCEASVKPIIEINPDAVRFLQECPAIKGLLDSMVRELSDRRSIRSGSVALVVDPDSNAVSVRFDVNGNLRQEELDSRYLQVANGVDWRLRYRLSVISE